jgi:hypothetical protein
MKLKLYTDSSLVFAVLSVVICFGSASLAGASTSRPNDPPPLAVLYDDVIARLTSGKTYVYVVPFETLSKGSQDDEASWNDCIYAGLTSERGLNDAASINRVFRQLSLSVTYAQASSSCLALNARSYVLSGVPTVYVETEDFDPYSMLKRLNIPDGVLRTRIQGQFTNGHDGAVKLMVGARMAPEVAPHPVLADLDPGDAAIFIEDGSDTPKLIARLRPAQWKELADYAMTKKRLRERAARNAASAKSK